MRPLTLLLLLLLVTIGSCSTTRHTATDHSTDTTLNLDTNRDTRTHIDATTLITAARALQLHGIHIDFYPPDSLHPDIRPAPRSITIDTATTKDTATQSTTGTADVADKETVNLSTHTTDTGTHTRHTATQPLTITDIVAPALALILLSLLIYLLTRTLRRIRSPT